MASGARCWAVSASTISPRPTMSACWRRAGRSTRPTRTSGLFHLKHGAQAPERRQGTHRRRRGAFSFKRINTDPQSKQKQNIAPVKEMIAVDPYTVKIVTKEPTASLLEFLFDRFIITGKDLYDKYGAREADRKYPVGMGTLQAQGSRDRPAHRAGEGQQQSGRSSRKTRTRSSSRSCASRSSA